MGLLNPAFLKGSASALDLFSSLSPNEHCPEWGSKEVASVLQMRTHIFELFIEKDTRFRQIQGWLKQHPNTHPGVKRNPSLSYCQICKAK